MFQYKYCWGYRYKIKAVFQFQNFFFLHWRSFYYLILDGNIYILGRVVCVNRNFVGASAYPVLSLFTFTVLFTLTTKKKNVAFQSVFIYVIYLCQNFLKALCVILQTYILLFTSHVLKPCFTLQRYFMKSEIGTF